MPRKGAVYPPGLFGCVVGHEGSGHRMQLARMLDLGVSTTTHGPVRATEAEAHQDLARARQSGTRRGMFEYVRALRGRLAIYPVVSIL